MKLSIPLKTENGYKKFEVEGYPVFEMYGHKFLAHRGIDLKNGRAHYRRNDWRVSEAETGAVIVKDWYFMDAVRRAVSFLAHKTEEQFRKAINRAKKVVEG